MCITKLYMVELMNTGNITTTKQLCTMYVRTYSMTTEFVAQSYPTSSKNNTGVIH